MQRARAIIKKILIDEQTIRKRLRELGREISRDYAGKDIYAIAIMNGSIFFFSDLLRQISAPLQISTVTVSSYHGGTSRAKQLDFEQFSLEDINGEHILLLDDILDSGGTMNEVSKAILALGEPASFKTCVLLNKQIERSNAVEADYKAFDIGDEFVVGYGLDYRKKYRNLPYIGVLRDELIT